MLNSQVFVSRAGRSVLFHSRYVGTSRSRADGVLKRICRAHNKSLRSTGIRVCNGGLLKRTENALPQRMGEILERAADPGDRARIVAVDPISNTVPPVKTS